MLKANHLALVWPLLWIAGWLMPAASHGQIEFDPTRPYAADVTVRRAAQGGGKKPELQAIFTRSGARHALINGHLLAEGDATSNFVIESIENDRVVVSSSGGQRQLVLTAKIKERP